MTAHVRTLVIGAGPSGLSAAHRLLELSPSEDLLVIDGAERAGGWIGTLERDGFVIERGADSILPQGPGFLELVERLGIAPRLVRTRSDRHGAYVLHQGRLERIPEGWSLLGPVSLDSLRFAKVLSLPGRARVMAELAIPPRPDAAESLAEFARRRLGWEALERLGQPLASGIYGSDAEVLGLAVTLPRFHTMEAEHGGVVRGLAAERRAKAGQGEVSGARYGLFCAFDRGMQVLVDALAGRVGPRLSLRERAEHVTVGPGGYAVETSRRTVRCERLVMAAPGPMASALLGSLDGELAASVGAVPHASAATVTFAFDRHAIGHPLDAYGVVVPAVERRRVLAMTFASEKWPGRAPKDAALIRVFVAGPGDGHERGGLPPELDERTDEALTRTALRELDTLLGVRGAPRFSIVSRFPRAMPRYGKAHAAIRQRALAAAARHPGLALAGNALTGVGIPHAIASGERAAEALVPPPPLARAEAP